MRNTIIDVVLGILTGVVALIAFMWANSVAADDVRDPTDPDYTKDDEDR